MSLETAQNTRLVVADVDGTLLNSQHALTAATRKTLLALQRGGIAFTLATGKILPSVSDIIRQLELSQPLILSNGALVQLPDGTVLFEDPIPQHCLSSLISEVTAHGLDYALYMPNVIFVPRNTFNTMLLVEFGDPFPVEANPMDLTGKNFCKLLILERDDPTRLERMESLLNERYGDAIKAKRSVPGMLEVFNSNTSKSVALQKIASHLGLSLDQIMVIGDSYNDLDMFRVAGTAIAMGNAPLPVKQMAHISVGSNDEDGIATFLNELFPWLQ
jgi:Cof subfamily protein (haloacid dehalogenase superfamily)